MANPIVLLFRHAVEARLEALFRRGDRVLDVGGGAGEMVPALTSRGIRVASVDVENLIFAGGGFDGAYADLGAPSGGSASRGGHGARRRSAPGRRDRGPSARTLAAAGGDPADAHRPGRAAPEASDPGRGARALAAAFDWTDALRARRARARSRTRAMGGGASAVAWPPGRPRTRRAALAGAAPARRSSPCSKDAGGRTP